MRCTRFVAAAVSVALVAFTHSTPAAADAADVIIGGAAGFAVGTVFGNATARPRYYAPAPVYVGPAPPPVVYYYGPEPWTPEWYSYCARKYASFDARSGTYVDFDGYRHMCH